ncbi:MAG TPA: DUF87 domain-containing protein [Bryobacteraceae bacterium]|nr:DUF87 domain-containing protein [Bryobacteraceae bacterium]
MPAKALHLGHDFDLPVDAVTQKFAFLGRTGSGKTYAATKLAEEMFSAGAQIIALDPVGVWYGLRLSKNGKDKGLEIPVFGGLHGDIPLEPGAGALIADLLIDRTISAIVDVSQMIQAEQQRFAYAFATRLFERRKRTPGAMMLFLEECQEFVPQNPMKGDEHMLHSFNRLCKIGRNFGIGVSLLSQRPQEINKKVLNLTECMFAFQMTGPHERKTVKEWFSYVGDDAGLVDRLPKLRVGSAYVSSPQWLRYSGEVAIAEKRTFNASSTPKVGAAPAQVKPLDPIDLEKIRSEMAETIERAKADDPRELRKQIAELKKQITHPPASNIPDKVLPADRLQKEFEKGVQAERRRIREELVPQLQDITNLHARIVRAFEGNPLAAIGMSLDKISELLNKLAPIPDPNSPPPPRTVPQAARAVPAPARAAPRKEVDPDSKITGPEQRILDAIAWMESIGIEAPEQTAVAFLAGYTYGGGAFNNPRGALRTKELVEYVGGDRIRLTDAGRAIATFPDSALTANELQMKVLERLPGPERKILSVLIEAYPNSMSNEECASAAGYAPNGGAYNNPRGRLRTLGLIDYPDRGHVRALPLLFLER